MLEEENEILEKKIESDEEETKPVSLPDKQDKEEPEYEDKAGGRALNVFSKLFFILTIIGTVLTGVMIFLPIFLGIVGVISIIAWLFGMIFLSIITVGLIWTVDEFKTFNDGWMNFNTSMFNSTVATTQFAMNVLPCVLISVGGIFVLAWLFTILGRVLDKFRRKKYSGRITFLAVITSFFFGFVVLNIILYSKP